MSISSMGARKYYSIVFKFIIYIIIFFIFLTSFSINCSSEQNQTTTTIPDPGTRQGGFDKTEALEWIEGTLEFTFEDPIRFTIFGTFKIHEIFLPQYAGSGQLTADAIRKQYSLEIENNPLNPPIKLALNQKINELFERILNNSYPGTIYALENPKIDISSLNYPVDANLYDPPVIMTQYCSFLELNEDSYFSQQEQTRYNIRHFEDLIEGTLKMGATVTQNLKLFANAGHINTFIFNVKQFSISHRGGRGGSDSRQGQELEHDQLLIDHPESTVSSPDKSMVSFTLDNSNGLSYVTKSIKGLKLYSKKPNRMIREKVEIEYNFDLRDYDTLIINNSKITINALKLDRLLSDLPSNFSNLAILSADGIRLFFNNGIVNLSRLDAELEMELDRISGEFEQVLNTTTLVDLGIKWDSDSVVNLTPLYYLDDTNKYYRMGSERQVTGYLSSMNTIKLGLVEDASVELVRGLLNAGAKATLDISIKSKYNYKYNLTLPVGANLFGHNPIDLTNEGRYKYLLSPLQLKKIVLESNIAPRYASSKASIEVDIDLHEIEILGFTEYKGHIKVTARGTLNHLLMEPNSRFSRSLPKEMTMDYFNSDALRLIYTEELLNFTEIEDEMYSVLQENITKLLDEDFKMHVDFDSARLKFDGNVDLMNDVEPIYFRIEASGKMRISENRLVKMGGFITKQIQLPTAGVENWNVTYNFILPKYIEIIGNPWVSETNTEYVGPNVDESTDNRYKLSVTIVGDQPAESETADYSEEFELEINIDIDITLWFFLNKIVLPIVLMIILIITIIMISILRRRKKKRLAKLKDELGLTVDDEDLLELNETQTGTDTGIWTPIKRDGFNRRFRNKNISGTKRYATGYRQDEDYSERLRELVPEQEKRQNRPPRSMVGNQTRTQKQKRRANRPSNKSKKKY
jgi:hypothetical protein